MNTENRCAVTEALNRHMAQEDALQERSDRIEALMDEFRADEDVMHDVMCDVLDELDDQMPELLYDLFYRPDPDGTLYQKWQKSIEESADASLERTAARQVDDE